VFSLILTKFVKNSYVKKIHDTLDLIFHIAFIPLFF